MSQTHRLQSNGTRLPPNNGAHDITTGAGEPDPKKEAFLARLNDLRVWLGRKYASFPRPCADRAAVEDLTRLINLIAQAERTGRSNAARVWAFHTASQTDAPGPENWLG